ncbi:MAG TPA: hypothetical protein VHA11_04320 [Bryobacteraceae bacterium]|nr:hypothetical protein [Bryobacteraceae bacterium]
MFFGSRLHVGLSLILAPAFLMPAYAQVGLGLSPMRTEVRLSAGARYSGALTLTNDSAVKSRVSAELLDFYIDDTANPQFRRDWPSQAAFSCRKWLVINPMEAELDPQSQLIVRYSLRVPADAAARGYHCAVGFSTLPVAANLSDTGIRTAVRVVAAFYATVGSPAVSGALKSMRLDPVPEAEEPAWRATVVIENTGDVYFRPTGKLEIFDSTGRLVRTAEFNPMPVLPRREQAFPFPLQLRAGTYTMRARVDLGLPEIQEATATVVARNPE